MNSKIAELTGYQLEVGREMGIAEELEKWMRSHRENS